MTNTHNYIFGEVFEIKRIHFIPNLFWVLNHFDIHGGFIVKTYLSCVIHSRHNYTYFIFYENAQTNEKKIMCAFIYTMYKTVPSAYCTPSCHYSKNTQIVSCVLVIVNTTLN